MDLAQIQFNLQQTDFQYRLQAVKALQNYPAELAVPMLLDQLSDREFLVRTFVVMALGKHRTEDCFAPLLAVMKTDDTPSVRAEAANSLSLFGQVSASQLVTAFIQDDHWLLRRSILAALTDMGCGMELLEVTAEGIQGSDPAVQEACLAALGSLAQTPQAEAALDQLLPRAQDESPRIRRQVAIALQRFDSDRAQQALQILRQDENHQVVAATLESLGR
jgi:HEAT repeat protein